jgi:hypothetical protein
LNIYSVSGALQKSVKLTQDRSVITRDNLGAGMYIVTVTSADGSVALRNKLVLQ